MSRLDTVRLYWIERFFALLTGDPEFAGLAEPAELFGPGGFNVPATPAGFVRVPTVATVRDRIAAAASAAQRDGLKRFERILTRILAQLFGSLADMEAETAAAAARRMAPVIRHPDKQTYWPIDVARYLSYDDGTLRGRLYSAAGAQPLAGNLFAVLFDNPGVWAAGAAGRPFESRQPFAATIGLDAGVLPFPGSPLTAGRLNLSAADARLTPGLLRPTVYVEMKSLAAALRNNRHYTAAGSGRFAELRRNRIHSDPLLTGLLPLDRSAGEASALQTLDPILVVYHGFYPADDGGRRARDGTGTNREFHHLAVGMLFPSTDETAAMLSTRRTARTALLFVSDSPTTVRVLPLSHPTVQYLDDTGGGVEEQGGMHPVIFANTLAIQGYGLQGEVDKDSLKDTAKDGLDYDPDSWQWWVGLAAAVGLGAGAGAFGGPVGAAIGAAVGLLVYLLAWLLKKLFGGDKDRKKEWTEQEPWPGGDGRPTQQSYTQSAGNDIGPPGTTLDSGGVKPGRSYDLKLIPHLPENNLYGLAFAGADTFRILDDPAARETLAWLAFDGGVGYQFDRPMPGRSDAAGSSVCNYFEAFTRKYLDLQQALAMVSYFSD